jgi:5,10-methylene-tetrahydrofolate dehydrogenase/methenyl tetrahydrofolate cyclohydrolase
MAAQTYQINYSWKNTQAEARDAAATLSAVMENAWGYGFTVVDIGFNTGTGISKIKISGEFPQEEVDSFAGTITPVSG